jgi:chromosome segregation ATPase
MPPGTKSTNSDHPDVPKSTKSRKSVSDDQQGSGKGGEDSSKTSIILQSLAASVNAANKHVEQITKFEKDEAELRNELTDVKHQLMEGKRNHEDKLGKIKRQSCEEKSSLEDKLSLAKLQLEEEKTVRSRAYQHMMEESEKRGVKQDKLEQANKDLKGELEASRKEGASLRREVQKLEGKTKVLLGDLDQSVEEEHKHRQKLEDLEHALVVTRNELKIMEKDLKEWKQLDLLVKLDENMLLVVLGCPLLSDFTNISIASNVWTSLGKAILL